MLGALHSFYNAALQLYMLPNFGSLNSYTKAPWSETAGPKAASTPNHRLSVRLDQPRRPRDVDGVDRLLLAGAGVWCGTHGLVTKASEYQLHAQPMVLQKLSRW